MFLTPKCPPNRSMRYTQQKGIINKELTNAVLFTPNAKNLKKAIK